MEFDANSPVTISVVSAATEGRLLLVAADLAAHVISWNQNGERLCNAESGKLLNFARFAFVADCLPAGPSPHPDAHQNTTC